MSIEPSSERVDPSRPPVAVALVLYVTVTGMFLSGVLRLLNMQYDIGLIVLNAQRYTLFLNIFLRHMNFYVLC
jgi:hypothetical protein